MRSAIERVGINFYGISVDNGMERQAAIQLKIQCSEERKQQQQQIHRLLRNTTTTLKYCVCVWLWLCIFLYLVAFWIYIKYERNDNIIKTWYFPWMSASKDCNINLIFWPRNAIAYYIILCCCCCSLDTSTPVWIWCKDGISWSCVVHSTAQLTGWLRNDSKYQKLSWRTVSTAGNGKNK